jgi:HEAT repeat protein
MTKPDTSKSGRPPPLPARTPPATKGGAAARARAFLTIQRLRMIDRFRRTWGWFRNRPWLTAGVAAVVAAAIAGYVYVDREGIPELSLSLPDVEIFAPRTVKEARQAVREHPGDAGAHRALGHVLWEKRKRHAALLSYTRALGIDTGVADADMVRNLVASFGTSDQDLAEALIWKNKLVGAEDGLERLVKSPRRKVRWGAVHTLDKLEKGTRGNWETAYILDLDASDCDVRRNAVEKLGAIGTKRAVAALRSARDDDEKTGGWFKSRCLGDRLDDAEQKILARR